MGLAVAAWLSAHHPWVPRKHLLNRAEHHSSTAALQLLPWGVGDGSRWQANNGSPQSIIPLEPSLLYEMESMIPSLLVVGGVKEITGLGTSRALSTPAQLLIVFWHHQEK